MKNLTQIERFRNLVDFIEKNFMQDIAADDIQEHSFYSYRNMNRIFQALQHETIGQYIKRLRLEKAAEFLKYSTTSITDIAFELGYNDLASFSKAFKKKYKCSPAAFRSSEKMKIEITDKIISDVEEKPTKLLAFEIETLPDFEVLFLQYQGSYENIKGIEKTWKQLVQYAFKKNLITKESILLAEILDDNEITESIFCRYNAAIALNKPLDFTPKGFFQAKIISSQKYAKFLHKGSQESSFDTYNLIFGKWLLENEYELADKAILEFYLNDEVPEEELLTEIYIPIL